MCRLRRQPLAGVQTLVAGGLLTPNGQGYTKKSGRFTSLAFAEKLLWETLGRPLAAIPNVEVEERHQGALPLS